MKHLIKFLSLAMVFLAFSFTTITAQEKGTVRGKIIDGASGDPLMFATVVVKELGTTGTQTDLDGAYELKLDEGTYSLEISYVGYTNNTITDVRIIPGEVTVLDYVMQSSSEVLDEIVIISESIERNEVALLKLQQKSNKIQDAISAQSMSRYSSSNAADAIKRTSGTSIVGGRYVIVRGLGDRYSNAQLNGLLLPSTDPYRNSTQLDMIPANMLDNIISSKSFSPDQPGNFTGGSVNINTKSFPEQFTFQASLSSSYNTQSSLRDDFFTHRGGSTDWLGFDDGGRDIDPYNTNPEILDVITKSTYTKARTDDEKAAILDQSADAFNPNFGPEEGQSFMDYSVSVSAGNQYQVGNNPLGVLFGVNFRKSYNFFKDAPNNYWELGGASATQLSPWYEMTETRGVENPTIGALGALSYKIGKSSKISLIGLYNHDTEKISRSIFGQHPGKLSDSEAFMESSVLNFQERALQSYQLISEHKFGESGIKLDFGGSVTSVTQLEPDQRLLAHKLTINNGETEYEFDRAEFGVPYHTWRDLDDKQYLGKADLTIPFLQEQSKENQVKVGFLYTNKDRTFSDFAFTLNERSNAAVPYTGDRNAAFTAENMGWLGVDPNNGRNIIGWYWNDEEILSNRNSYSGHERVTAGYIMGVYDFGQKLKAIGGVRVEQTDISVASRDTNSMVGNIDTLDILPSINLVYKLNDRMNLRASYTHTVGRPNMRELAPFSADDFIGGMRISGNPNLKSTLVKNYDVRWEFFPSAGELIALSGFYKDFTNPIVKGIPPAAANPEIIFQNVDEAMVYGIELEFRKQLNFISPALSDFSLSTNLSLIKSEQDMPADECETINEHNPEKGCTRPFFGQSPLIINAGLNYNNDEKGLDATLAFNVFGERLITQTQATSPDIYEQPRPLLDFNLSKQVTEKFDFKLSVQNILNTRTHHIMNYLDVDYTVLQYRDGITVSFGIAYSI